MENGQLIHEIFEKNVLNYPDNIALEYEGIQITYNELNQRANLLAHHIANDLCLNGSLIGIFMEKNIESIIAMLAILKSGNGYVPIEITYPKARIDYILELSEIEYIISNNQNSAHQSLTHYKIVDVDGRYNQLYDNLSLKISDTSLSYVIFTSGTTGNPKGVMITHSNVVGLMKNTKELFDFTSHDKWSVFHSFCFDFSVWEIYGTLLYGGCGVIVPESTVKDPIKTSELIKHRGVTVLNQVPSSFYNLDDADVLLSNCFNSIRYVIFGGEGLKPQKLFSFNNRYPNTKLINMYGITEITVHGTFKEITKKEIDSNDSNIGKALPGLCFHLLDLDVHKPVKEGEIGEIVVSGYGVASGYKNRPDLTSDKFKEINNDGHKYYFSGDLGRLNSDGEIIYSGRCDNQVKIRGFRVELSEIETALLKINGINDAVVLMSQDEDNNDELFAFIVTDKTFTSTRIRAQLDGNLPRYMMPYYIIDVKNIPLTANGKYDRRKLLLEKNNLLPTDEKEIRLPESDIEKKVASYLSDLFHKDIDNLMENFFELGGDSLKAAKLINAMREWGYSLSFDNLFDSESILDLIINAKYIDITSDPQNFNNERYLETSLVEKRMFSVSSSNDTKAYNITIPLSLKGTLDYNKLSLAINKVMREHEIFRCQYVMDDLVLIKVIQPLKEINLSPISIDFECFVENYDDYVCVFKPNHYPLYDIKLYKHRENDYTLLLNFHHIMFDGISLEVFLQEVFALYQDEHYNLTTEIPYSNFVEKEKSYLKSKEYLESRDYWKSLSFGEDCSELPRDFKRPTLRSFKGETLYHSVDNRLKSKITKTCKNLKISPYMFTQGIFHILLARLTSQHKVVSGTIVSGRPDMSFEKSIGMFVNTLPFVSNPQPNMYIKDYFKEIRKQSIELFEHQMYPFDQIVKDHSIVYQKDRNSIFDYMFVYQHFRETSSIKLDDHLVCLFDSLRREADFSKFDMTLEYIDYPEESLLRLNYDTSLFNRDRMQNIMKLYENTIHSVIDNLDNTLVDIDILTPEEKKILLEDFNDTYQNIKEDPRCLTRYVSDHINIYPDKKAVVTSQSHLSFNDVEQLSNYYAKQIANHGFTRNDIVAIYLPRSIELYVAMVSIVKSGAAILILDTSLPSERVDYMIKDSKCSIIITNDSLVSQINHSNILLMNKDDFSTHRDNLQFAIEREQDDLAYVIYTSGTTGKPKGVKLRSISTVNMCDFMARCFCIENSVHLTVAAVTFDMFIIDFFLSIAMKSTLVIPSDDERIDNDSIAELMSKERVETVVITPTRLDTMATTHPDSIRNLKVVLCGGEILTSATTSKVKLVSDTRVLNFYGPSEATVYCTGSEVFKNQEVTIGYPAVFSKIYVANEFGQLMPIGYEGELLIGGNSVGLGYIGRDDLTNEKFVKNPFHDGVLYKSGDRAIFRQDGQLIFKGRHDHQVKINGYRIELGEIENAILTIDEVEFTNVHVAQSNGAAELRGFVSGKVAIEDVECNLKKSLPYYMIPKLFKVDEIPMTHNGKVDTKALSQLFENEYLEAVHEIVEASDETEAILLEAYREILGKIDLGVTDNFFYNGGDSIKAIQLVSRLRKHQIKINVSDIMLNTDIRSLSKNISFDLVSEQPKDRKELGVFPLTPILRFYFERNRLTDDNFNQSMILESKTRIDRDIAVKAFEVLIETHGMLRTVYSYDSKEIIAECLPYEYGQFQLDYYSCYKCDTEEMLRKLDEKQQQDISINDGNLLKVSLLNNGDMDYLVIGIHHIAVDGISFRIFIRDFIDVYTSLVNNQKISLDATDTMLMWSNYWNQFDYENDFVDEIDYWTEMMKVAKKIPKPFEEPTSFAKSEEIIFLSRELSSKLLTQIHEKYLTTVQDVLMTSFIKTFKDKNHDSIKVYMEGHGREMDGTGLDISNTLGWFTTLYPIVFTINEDKGLGLTLREVKDSILKIPRKGMSYGLLKYLAKEDLCQKIGLDYKIKPGYAFNYMGEVKAESKGDFKIIDKNEEFDVSDNIDINIGLTYNIVLIDGRFKISAIYNKTLLSDKQVSDGLRRFEEHLRQIITFIEHSEEESILSASDFSDSCLSNDELDDLLEYMDYL